MPTFAIYARYSSDRQRETSIEDQVRRCREYIASKDGDPGAARVFSDYAMSGASLDRPGFESLMAGVDSGNVEVIVTESLDRISRDFADSAAIFKKLQYARVPLIGVADGIDTGERNAKLGFTIKSLLGDLYLDDLRDKTLRGLEGRALAGKATGNVPYGFRTVPADDGSGSEIAIDDEQAKLVQRIFELFRDGHSYAQIAKALNAERIPSPRARTKHESRGWPHTTIRSMLKNERYIGVWTYKTTEWVKVPGTNKRRPRKRDDAEVIRAERPHLRIVPEDLWSAVQMRLERIGKRYKSDRREPSIASRAVYPLSGLIRCTCGAPMSIYGGSRTAKRYRCADNIKRGTCENSLSVKEEIARRVILSGVRARLMRPAAIEFIRKEFARGLGEASRSLDVEIDERRKRLARTEGKIRGLIEFIAGGDRSSYVVETLHDLEVQAKADKAAIKSLRDQARKPIALPSADELIGSVLDVEQAIAEDPVTGRERLHALFSGRRIDLEVVEGVYVAKSALLPLVALQEPQKDTADPERGRRYIELVAGARFELATFGL